MDKIYIIGGANIDISGIAANKLVPAVSNIGKISYSFGGVGRNIAENLARLNQPVSLVTIFGQDLFGQQLKAQCEALKIDISFSLTAPTNSSSYLAILDEEHELSWAIADMDILNQFTIKHFQKLFKIIKPTDYVVVDTNVPTNILEYILTFCPAPLYLDPISSIKALKVKDHLKQLYLFKPNASEARALSQIDLQNTADYQANLAFFLQAGVKEIVISLAQAGVIAARAQEAWCFKHRSLPMVNATGAGDAFLAGYLAATMKQLTFKEKIAWAISCAALTTQSLATVSCDLNDVNVEIMQKKLKIEAFPL